MAVRTAAVLKTNIPIGTTLPNAQAHHDIIDTFEDRCAKLETRVVSAKTANYTATATDTSRVITFNAAAEVTFTIPNTLLAGWNCTIVQLGAGQVTVAVTGGALRHPESHTKTSAQYAAATLTVYANAGSAPQVSFVGQTAV